MNFVDSRIENFKHRPSFVVLFNQPLDPQRFRNCPSWDDRTATYVNVRVHRDRKSLALSTQTLSAVLDKKHTSQRLHRRASEYYLSCRHSRTRYLANATSFVIYCGRNVFRVQFSTCTSLVIIGRYKCWNNFEEWL